MTAERPNSSAVPILAADSAAFDGVDSNASLAQRFAEHDSGAFAILVQRYQQFVYRICFGILRHRQDAEDATQETFTRVARYLHRWDRSRPLEPWLATVAGNRSRTQLSLRRNLKPLAVVSEPETCESGQTHDANALREELSRAIRTLPQRQRDAFQLFHEHSMPYAEIAAELDCPIGTVKTLVHRARVALIAELNQREVLSSATSSGASSGGQANPAKRSTSVRQPGSPPRQRPTLSNNQRVEAES